MKKTVLLIGLAVAALLSSCSDNAKTMETETTTEVVAEEAPAPEVTEEEVAETQVIKLEQVAGEFTNGDITLEAGSYSFEVMNNGVGHEVGLVVAPKKEDEITAEDHLANAYVAEVVKDGESQPSKGEVTLEAGEYVYFCPLNPTPQYTITVK